MNKILIDLDAFETIKEFHLWLKEQCHFPEYYGCNLDALYDCLSEDPNYEFEIKDSTKYEIYQIQLINTVVDAGCQGTYLTKESPLL